jgi:hypothetical protein
MNFLLLVITVFNSSKRTAGTRNRPRNILALSGYIQVRIFSLTQRVNLVFLKLSDFGSSK